MPIQSGKLAGLATLRDNATVTYQSQLDEVARGLIEVFKESDQRAVPLLPDVPGLFTYPGAPAMLPTAADLPRTCRHDHRQSVGRSDRRR